MMLLVFNFRAQVIIVVTWSCFCSEFQKMNHWIRLTVLYSPLGLFTSPQSKEQLRLKILSVCLQQLACYRFKISSLFIYFCLFWLQVCLRLIRRLFKSKSFKLKNTANILSTFYIQVKQMFISTQHTFHLWVLTTNLTLIYCESDIISLKYSFVIRFNKYYITNTYWLFKSFKFNKTHILLGSCNMYRYLLFNQSLQFDRVVMEWNQIDSSPFI